eukprot:TRINITY_DN6978_c0_g1_i2.p1 TRINITY_DN6978_c0_g1~~TRINITY_DN6978_c0_g1_i2.p1  ORF type:complete len:483 (+),score=111.48 TRINITY_DN6978_c0_g1_i2:68-1450(+)
MSPILDLQPGDMSLPDVLHVFCLAVSSHFFLEPACCSRTEQLLIQHPEATVYILLLEPNCHLSPDGAPWLTKISLGRSLPVIDFSSPQAVAKESPEVRKKLLKVLQEFEGGVPADIKRCREELKSLPASVTQSVLESSKSTDEAPAALAVLLHLDDLMGSTKHIRINAVTLQVMSKSEAVSAITEIYVLRSSWLENSAVWTEPLRNQARLAAATLKTAFAATKAPEVRSVQSERHFQLTQTSLHACRAFLLVALDKASEAVSVIQQLLPPLATFTDVPAKRLTALLHNLGGVALRSMKQYTEALQQHKAAISIFSAYAGAYCNSGIVLLSLQRVSEAAAAFKRALEIEPTSDIAQNGCGMCADLLNQPDVALEHYTLAIAQNPRFALALNNRGCVYRNQKRYTEALADFSAALDVSTDTLAAAAAYDNRGCVLGDLGKLDEVSCGIQFSSILHRKNTGTC